MLSPATCLTPSISDSASRTYTKPLEITSGFETISLLSCDIVTTTIIRPSCERCFLSRVRYFRHRRLQDRRQVFYLPGTVPAIFAVFESSSSTWPFESTKLFFSGIPTFCASSLWRTRWRCSPCTGIKNFGFVSARISFIPLDKRVPKRVLPQVIYKLLPHLF